MCATVSIMGSRTMLDRHRIPYRDLIKAPIKVLI